MNGWNCIVFFVRSTDLMALISINKIIRMGNLSQEQGQSLTILAQTILVQGFILSFRLPFAPRFWMEGAVLDWQGLSLAGFTDGTHVQLTVADWFQLGDGVERKVEQPEPANPPGSAATSECIDYTFYTEVEVEEEEVTPGERVSPGRPLRPARRLTQQVVTTNTRIIDLNIDHVDTQDDRRIEVIANGRPLWGGAQLAVDTTLVSPLTRAGHPRMRGRQYRGTALRDARRNKERTYPELLRDRRCRLVVVGIEVGGRWSFLRLLAHTKARQAPALLRHSLTNALVHRWSAMLTHAAMHAFAASLLDQDLSGCHNLEGNAPSISEILAEATSPPHYGRLPAPS